MASQMGGLNLVQAVQEYIGKTSPQAISEAIGTVGKWGATEADYLDFFRSKGYTVLEGTLGEYAVFKNAETVFGGNGATAEVSSVFETTATEITTTGGAQVTKITATGTGAGLLGMKVGVAGACIAPALGLVAGFALYNIAPEFWEGVSDSLLNAGKLIDGKVQGILGTDGKTSFDQETIEIYKNAFANAGYFSGTATPPDYSDGDIITQLAFGSVSLPPQPPIDDPIYQGTLAEKTTTYNRLSQCYAKAQELGITSGTVVHLYCTGPSYGNDAYLTIYNGGDASQIIGKVYHPNTQYSFKFASDVQIRTSYGVLQVNQWSDAPWWRYGSDIASMPWITPHRSADNRDIIYANIAKEFGQPEHAQEGATLPDGNPFPSTYNDWHPSKTINNNNYYPVSMPTDDIKQNQSQSGQNDDDQQIQEIVNNYYGTDPAPDPSPDPDPDPDPQPEPEPLPYPTPTPVPIPSNPNPDPEDSENTPTVPVTPSTPSNSMFAVYNPTEGQLDSLGAFLWSSSIIDQIKQIWQNPVEGIIALHKVYVAPTTGGSQNILLGYVDSGVSSALVTSQFVEVDCGSVLIKENKKNATDYSPFTQIQIYLPFIGIQELDTNEIMGGSVNVKYKVDVYTGTCIAMIFVTRSPDMTNAQLLYTFSGNCSQKLPLTSSDFSSGIASLLGIVGIGVASGGALGALAGAGAVAHSLTQDMVHIQHSGGLSANSGILAPRKPFIIISRQYGYDANNYGDIYGFPANKTIYLSSCSGYTRVKSINYQGRGTQEEKQMVVDALKGGVIL